VALQKIGQLGSWDYCPLAYFTGRDLAGGDQLIYSGAGKIEGVCGTPYPVGESGRGCRQCGRLFMRGLGYFGFAHRCIHLIVDGHRDMLRGLSVL
jgi:hypothetical protein